MKKYFLCLLGLLLLIPLEISAQEKKMSQEEAWSAIRSYQHGDDFLPIILVADEVEKAACDPAQKKAVAAKLASLLTEETSVSGRQFIFDQLRVAGTAEQVPLIAKYLQSKDDAESARLALTDIEGEESLVPLRQALQTAEGRLLVGVIGALADRNDITSMKALASFCDSKDPAIARAAVEGLGKYGCVALPLLESVKPNVPNVVLEATYLKMAKSLSQSKKISEAKEILNRLASEKSTRGTRRASFQMLYELSSDSEKQSLISDWFFSGDAEKNVIAASHLKEMPTDVFQKLSDRYGEMSPQQKRTMLALLPKFKSEKMVEEATRALDSEDSLLRLMAIRMLGVVHEPSVLTKLISMLNSDEATQTAVEEALRNYTFDLTVPLLLESLNKPELRDKVIDCLAEYKCQKAIAPLLQLARSDDKNVYKSSIAGLTKICSPQDISQLFTVYLASDRGKYRETLERMIVTVCEKEPVAANRAKFVLQLLEKQNGGLEAQLTNVLPLLGKIGNANVYEMIKANLSSSDPARRAAAVRAFCNWPNADYLDELWAMAKDNSVPLFQYWTLRAAIRIMTLKSDRPAAETLKMLQEAMALSKTPDNKKLCLSRAQTIRLIETVVWVAKYLDDPELSETASETIVSLAHHRFLREPNKALFLPILTKIEKNSSNPKIAEQALKARLGM